MVFNATSNNISVISWRSVLLGEEIWVSGENNRPVVRHWQSCIGYTSPWTGLELTTLVVMSTDYTYDHDGPTLIVEDLFVVHHHYCRHFIDRYIVISFFLVVSNRKQKQTNKNKQTKNKQTKTNKQKQTNKNKQTKTNKQKTAVGKVILI